MTSNTERYYDGNATREWERLARAYNTFEFRNTLHLMERHMMPGARVCDVGGGPGRYTLECLRRGFPTTLVDLSAGNLAIARRELAAAGFEDVPLMHANACNLSLLESGSFDVVLLMGPLYHLLTEEERLRALSEMHRILAPGGVAFLAWINGWGVVRAMMTKEPASLPEELDLLLRSHSFSSALRVEGDWECHVTTPPRALAETQRAGFEVVTYAGVEGFASGQYHPVRKIAEERPALLAKLVELSGSCCEHPAYRDSSEHLLVVCRKGETS